jgi:methionyl aminopeptidase
VGLDCGIDLGGFVSDQAVSVEAGKVSGELHALNVTTQECLYRAIAAIKPKERLLQISRAVEGHAVSKGYGVVHEYCGHGVGFALHEDPQVPNYPHGPNPRMNNGMVFAIEPMINMGTGDVELANDGWTVLTADDQPSAHWEHTVAIFGDKVEILTDRLD